MRRIDAPRDMESLVTLLASVWELSRSVQGGGDDSPPPTHYGCKRPNGWPGVILEFRIFFSVYESEIDQLFRNGPQKCFILR